ncbi:MAG: hypothetical protein Q9170_001311 [Blastenia crenularia]
MSIPWLAPDLRLTSNHVDAQLVGHLPKVEASISHTGVMAPPRPNLTGFDIRKLVASSGPTPKDPWRRM